MRCIKKNLFVAVLASQIVLPAPAMAQGFFELFKNQGNSFAPSDDGKSSVPAPLSIIPLNPKHGAIPQPARNAPATSPAASPATAPAPAGKITPPKVSAPAFPAATGKKAEEEDEDDDLLVEHEEPKRVRVALPPQRPGNTMRTAAEVAPVGAARWSNRNDQLPPGVTLPGSTFVPAAAPRLASLPQTQTVPRWSTTSDANPSRPYGLRDVETPVAGMPGVFAPPDATFQCLPMGLKQALVDIAKRFGHVAILNAKRPRGTGARGSYHYQCRAVDFRVRGVAVRTVYNYMREHPNVGGRKIYPMGFFHMDDGPVRSW
ncbi:MAG: YcbK family protein [Beijerinckiaceae bacterium]